MPLAASKARARHRGRMGGRQKPSRTARPAPTCCTSACMQFPAAHGGGGGYACGVPHLERHGGRDILGELKQERRAVKRQVPHGDVHRGRANLRIGGASTRQLMCGALTKRLAAAARGAGAGTEGSRPVARRASVWTGERRHAAGKHIRWAQWEGARRPRRLK